MSNVEIEKAHLRLVEKGVIPKENMKMKIFNETVSLQLFFCRDGIDMHIGVASDIKTGMVINALCWGDAELTPSRIDDIEIKAGSFLKKNGYENCDIEFLTFLEELPNKYSYSTTVVVQPESHPEWEEILQMSALFGFRIRDAIKEMVPSLDENGIDSKRAPFSYMILNWGDEDDQECVSSYTESVNCIDCYKLDVEDSFKAGEYDIPFSV